MSEVYKIEPYYSLAEAAIRFFPGGKITARSLRTEIDNGNLLASNIAGKFVVSESAIAKMVEQKQCRNDNGDRGSTSSARTEKTRRSGSSEMERKQRARAAALASSRPPQESLKDTSPKHTGHPAAPVCRPRFS